MAEYELLVCSRDAQQRKRTNAGLAAPTASIISLLKPETDALAGPHVDGPPAGHHY